MRSLLLVLITKIRKRGTKLMHIRKCIAVILIRLFKQSPRLYPQGKEPKKSSVGKSSNVESVEESSANTSRKRLLSSVQLKIASENAVSVNYYKYNMLTSSYHF